MLYIELLDQIRKNGLLPEPADNRILSTTEFYLLANRKGYEYGSLPHVSLYMAILNNGTYQYPLISRSPSIQDPSQHDNYIGAASCSKLSGDCNYLRFLINYPKHCYLPVPQPSIFTKKFWEYWHQPSQVCFYELCEGLNPNFFKKLWFYFSLYFVNKKEYNDVSSKKIVWIMKETLKGMKLPWLVKKAFQGYEKKMIKVYGLDAWEKEIFRIYYQNGYSKLYEFAKECL